MVEQPVPSPASGDVLIRVHAAGVNRPDLLQRRGLYPAPAGASPLLGLEIAGEIVATGTSVEGVAVGDAVCALTNGGGYAEYVTVPATQCLPLPRHFTMAQAAVLPECLFTVWHNVIQRGALQAGETLLVHSGTSGIGTFAIQLGHALGATVYATAGSAEKCAQCIALGATAAFNYNTEDVVQSFLTSTSQRGADVILDMLGGDYIAKNMRMAAVDGRIVSIAFLHGARADINFTPILIKRLTLTGSTLRAQTTAQKAIIASELLQQVWPFLNSGKIKPVIDSVFSFHEANAAHARMESRAHVGKIVLVTEGQQ